MTNHSYDAIVIGLGAMGSAALFHLARRGVRALGIEQFGPAHDRGSSHGHSRVIRLAYFEDPAYVPLLRRAYELWQSLEREADRSLLTITGGLMMGGPDSEVVNGSLASARQHGLPHEMLDATEVRRRFPAFTPGAAAMAFYEPGAGVLAPEACVRAHLGRATTLGAELHFDEQVIEWNAPQAGGVAVSTTRGRYEAGHLLLTPGAWAGGLFDLPELPLEVERQVLYWLEPREGSAGFAAGQCPIYIWDLGEHAQIYGFPAQPEGPRGVKVAFFHTAHPTICTPETIDRVVHDAEVAAIRQALRGRIPALADGALSHAMTCMYTLTPDQHFAIGPHPRYPQVTLASPCSGHGFKFASVVGEILADLAIDGATPHPIQLFDPTRFARP